MLTVSEIETAVKELAPQYPIKKVLLFGSYATDMASASSDVDILVEFKNQAITLLDLYGFQTELSELLNVNVDIVQLPLSETVKNELVIDKVVPLYEQ